MKCARRDGGGSGLTLQVYRFRCVTTTLQEATQRRRLNLRGRSVSSRPKHPTKEIETLLQSLERHGWTVKKGKKYFRAYCGGGCHQHMKSVHITPSDPRYLQNLMGWLKRETCWTGAQR
jgi:hypothetical protein